jgi:hypothetical protein
MTAFEIILLILGTLLAISSYLFVFFGDHPLYCLNNELYVGGFAAYSLHSLQKSLMTTAFQPIAAGHYSLIIAVILGLAAFTRLTRWRWAARYSVTALTGVGLGVLLGLTIRAQLINNIASTITNVTTGTPDAISATIMFVGFTAVLLYFLYTAAFSNTLYTGRMKLVMRITRIFLYAGVGYLFVSSGGSGGGVGNWFVYYIRRTWEELMLYFSMR